MPRHRSTTPLHADAHAARARGARAESQTATRRREIAQALWITEETVRTHVRRLLDRLGARTRAHAVSIAYRDGLWAGIGR